MTDRPILFSGPLVRAILRGEKTQTRRPVRLPRWAGPQGLAVKDSAARVEADGDWVPLPCPYGAPGDRLWVRETFEPVHPCQVAEGRYSQPCPAGIPGPPPVDYRLIYRADGPYPGVAHTDSWPFRRADPSATHPMEHGDRWTPSSHMPRWASRLTLEIVGVRVERVQDITEEGARAEGFSGDGIYGTLPNTAPSGGPRAEFAWTWECLYGPGSWASNPWVWAIDFRRVDGGAR